MLTLPLFITLAAQGQTAKPFTLTASIPGLADRYVYMSYPKGPDQYGTDSVMAKDGKFAFKGNIKQPVEARLYLDKEAAMYGKGDVGTVFLESTAMQLKGTDGTLKGAKLTGSKTQLDQEALDALNASVMAELKPHSDSFNTLNEEYIAAMRAKKSDAELEPYKTTLDAIKDRMERYYDQMQKNTSVFIDKHPDSYVAVQQLRWRISGLTLAEAEAAYNKLTPRIKASMDGKEVAKDLHDLKMGSPGAVAYVFSKPDINGKTISLADYKGKYVMLDFWASWCGPCRKGNPHLKSLYTEYKDKGFEIIGVSDDDSNPTAWKKAVDQDGIGIWRHVLRGLDWSKRQKNLPNPEDVSDHFGIHTLPTKILIGPDGKIIGRYGGGGEDDDAMDKKLKELFGA